MFKRILHRNEVLLVTDKKRTHMQDLRHRRRVYNVIQALRIPLLALAGLCWMIWGLWWLAIIIFAISVPLPWVAVVIANGQGEPRDRRERAVYKPALAREMNAQAELAREMNAQAELEAERARALEAAPPSNDGKEIDLIRNFEGITIDSDEDLEKDDKND